MTDAIPRRTLVVGAAGFLALATAATVIGAVTRNPGPADSASSTELAVLAAARGESLALTTIRYQSVDADVARVLAGATGALRTQFEQERAKLPATLTPNKSSSTGKVLSAGILSLSGDTAKAVVAVDATVTGTDVGVSGVLKHYRMVVTLQRIDGRWLASNLAFAGQPQ